MSIKLFYTGLFGKNKSPENTKELNIEGDCTITNYDTRTDVKPAAYLKVQAKNNSIFLEEGAKSDTTPQVADFSNKKASVLAQIAGLDGDKSTLSFDDILQITQGIKDELIKKFNQNLPDGEKVTALAVDHSAGVLTVKWKENDVLRIDFATKNEAKPTQSTSSNDSITTNNVEKSSKTTSVAEIKSTEKVDVSDVISKFTGGNIDIDKVHDLATVAKYTGISEDYIFDVLVSLEGNKKWPVCVAEYDGVPNRKNPKGFLTIGFGHTSLAGEPKVTEGLEISEKQAYQILANDIINAKKLAVNKLKNKDVSFNEMPHSIQCAVIDIVFNKGPSGINNSLVENLKNEYYGAAARRTWYETENVGLQKRNMYRFISAIEDLNKKTKKAAVKNFRNEHFNHLQAVFKKDNDAKIAWNDMCKSISYPEASF